MSLPPSTVAERGLEVDALEADVVTALNAAIAAFDRIAQELAYGAEPDVVGVLGVDARYAEELRRRAVAMLARARPRDLRRVAAVLHATGCLQRLDARLDRLAGLAPSLVPVLSSDDGLRQTSELELIATRRWLVRARDAVSAGATTPRAAWPVRARPGGSREAGRSVLALAGAAQARGPSSQTGEPTLAVLADVLDHISVEAWSIAGGSATSQGAP